MTESATAETQPGRYVRANGLDIYYEEHGQSEGQSLVLIHGGTLTGNSWKPYFPNLAPHFRIITPDSRGHGRTANPSGPLSFGAMAEDVAALIRELGLEKPFVFGYSDGGQVTLELGMRYPDLAQALVIGGAYPELTEPSRRWIRSLLGDAGSPEVDIEKFERENADYAVMLKELHGAENWQALLKNIKPMWNATLNYTPADFARVTAPTLLVLADRDDFVSVEEGVAMYRLFPTAELAVFPGSDHGGLVFSAEKIALLQLLVLDFLLRHGKKEAQPTPA